VVHLIETIVPASFGKWGQAGGEREQGGQEQAGAELDRVASASSNNHVRGLVVSGGAGAVAGAVSVAVTQPFDTAKTNMQGLHSHRYRGLVDCLRLTVAEDGIAGLYKGVGPRLCRVIVEVSATFAAYDALVKAIDSMLEA